MVRACAQAEKIIPPLPSNNEMRQLALAMENTEMILLRKSLNIFFKLKRMNNHQLNLKVPENLLPR